MFLEFNNQDNVHFLININDISSIHRINERASIRLTSGEFYDINDSYESAKEAVYLKSGIHNYRPGVATDTFMGGREL